MTPNPQPHTQEVSVRDFDMPFMSMVNFMIKWALAAVPALILLAAIYFFITVVLFGIIVGMMRA